MVGDGSPKVFLHSRSCGMHMQCGMGRSPTDSGAGQYSQYHFGVFSRHYVDVDQPRDFFFPNAEFLKTVAVMSLQTLGQKEADYYSPERGST